MREPDAGQGRLTPVTAQTRAAERAHDAHDRLLVARHASGDRMEMDEVATLRAQLAGCSDCSALVADLQVVQRAVATSTTVLRPRDFRISDDQARELRPGAWQRLLARFSAPRVGALRPLAGATLAIGIVVVGVGVVAPGQVPTPNVETAPVVEDAPASPADPGTQLFLASPGSDAFDADPNNKATPAPDSVARVRNTAPTMESHAGTAAIETPAPTQALAIQAPAPSPGADDGGEDLAAVTLEEPGPGIGPLLLVLGGLLAAASLLVLVLGWLARRNVDPLLR
jgi:hypothetical protein